MGRNHLHKHQVPKDPSIYSSGHAARRDHRVLASVSRGYPRLMGSSITCYSPVRHFTRLATFTCDLHASSTPPTFVLSQDQTLHFGRCSSSVYPRLSPRAAGRPGPTPRGKTYLHFLRTHTLDFEATQYAKDRPHLAFGPSAGRGKLASCRIPSSLGAKKVCRSSHLRLAERGNHLRQGDLWPPILFRSQAALCTWIAHPMGNRPGFPRAQPRPNRPRGTRSTRLSLSGPQRLPCRQTTVV